MYTLYSVQHLNNYQGSEKKHFENPIIIHPPKRNAQSYLVCATSSQYIRARSNRQTLHNWHCCGDVIVETHPMTLKYTLSAVSEMKTGK